jgi:hypothetical protein
MNGRYSLIAVSALLFLLPCPAFSQPSNGSGNMIEELHDSLKLTPNQELGWLKYKKSLASASSIQDRRAAAAKLFPSINALRRMQLAKAELTQELADLESQSQALTDFYQTLTPEQQRTFDLKTLPPQQGRQAQH